MSRIDEDHTLESGMQVADYDAEVALHRGIVPDMDNLHVYNFRIFLPWREWERHEKRELVRSNIHWNDG
jgi:hypothetical protein